MFNRLKYATRTAHDWFSEARVAWLGAAGLLAIVSIVFLLPHNVIPSALERSIRILGTSVEGVGILCVAVGLSKIRSQFGLAPVYRSIVAYFARAVKIFKRQGGATIRFESAVGIAVSEGSALALANPKGTLEERIKRLEKKVEEVQIEISDQNAKFIGELKKLQSGVDAEAKARIKSDEAVRQMLTESMTGDFQLELVGLIYVCVGLFLANLSQEISSWLVRSI